jgi:hypothetical protein
MGLAYPLSAQTALARWRPQPVLRWFAAARVYAMRRSVADNHPTGRIQWGDGMVLFLIGNAAPGFRCHNGHAGGV